MFKLAEKKLPKDFYSSAPPKPHFGSLSLGSLSPFLFFFLPFSFSSACQRAGPVATSAHAAHLDHPGSLPPSIEHSTTTVSRCTTALCIALSSPPARQASPSPPPLLSQ
jgi:hypothetical protein